MQVTQPAEADATRRSDRRALLRWLTLAPLLLLFTSCCATVATLGRLPRPATDTSSQLSADYQPWPEIVFAPLQPEILAEIASDLGLSGTPDLLPLGGCFLPGEGCLTTTPTTTSTPAGPASPTFPAGPSATPSPTGTGGTPASSPTRTRTLPPTLTPTVTNTPTITNTPSVTPTPTPLVYPIKVADPFEIPPGASLVDFSVLVINYGNPTGALLTDVIDTLPPGMSLVAGSCDPAGCLEAGDTVSWSVSMTIPQGSFRRFSFTAAVSGAAAGDVLTNSVETRGGNFETAVNVRRVYVHTPTPSPTPAYAPNAVDDAYWLVEDTLLDRPAPGVLANDTDPSDPIQASLVSGPAHGSLTLDPAGSFRYQPAPNYSDAGLPDSFVYRACDPGPLCDNATVYLWVLPQPDQPIAVDDVYSVAEDASLAPSPARNVLANDSDADPLDTLTASLVLGSGPANGTLALGAGGAFAYTPDPDFFGTDQFSYQACDGTPLCDTAQVTITISDVNDPPLALDDPLPPAAIPVVEDTPADLDVLANDSDIDGGPLTIQSVTNPPHGTAAIIGALVRYQADADYSGPDSFTYTASDGRGGTDTATVTVDVQPVNDDPAAADDRWGPVPPDLRYLTGEGSALNVPAPGLAGNDSDIDNAAGELMTALVSGPASGTLECPPSAPPGICADGSFTYRPAAGFHGTDVFSYAVCDPGQDGLPGTGDELCDTASVTLLVDDPPLARPDAFTAYEDLTLVVLPPAGVMADNGSGPDTDPNSPPPDTVTVELTTAPPPAQAAVALNPDGSFTFTPSANFSGPVTFQYRGFDGWLYGNTVTVTVQVQPVNDAPLAVDDGLAQGAYTTVDLPVTIDVLANDSDVDGDPLRLGTISLGPAAHGTVVPSGDDLLYTPEAGFAGNGVFTYEACDAGQDGLAGNGDDECDAATVTVRVNGPPDAQDDNYEVVEDSLRSVAAPGVLNDDSDPNPGEVMRVVLLSGPSHAAPAGFSLSGDGSFSYLPAADYAGADEFRYQVWDRGADQIAGNGDDLSDATPAVVRLTVMPVNDDPVAHDDTASTAEDTPLSIPVLSLLANDTDPDGDPLAVVGVADPPHGSALLDDRGTPASDDDLLVYDPDWNYSGDDAFDYTVSDGNGGTGSARLTVTVTPVNDGPLAINDSYDVAGPGALLVPAAGVLLNDFDAEGDAMEAELLSGPADGQLSCPASGLPGICADGSFAYLPDPGFHGYDEFQYQACDPSAACGGATATLVVNRPPLAADDSFDVDEDLPSGLAVAAPGVLGNDSDPDLADGLQALPLPSGGDPAHGALTLDPDGGFLYVPDADYNGPDGFQYQACDPFNACATATVEVSVLPVNDLPQAQDDPEPPAVYRANSDGSTLLVPAPGVLANDSDIDIGDTLRAVWLAGPGSGVLALSEDGSFHYTAQPGASGSVQFDYQACDGGPLCDTATVTILLNAAPTAQDDPEPPVVYQVAEDGSMDTASLGLPGVLANDSDPESGVLTAALEAGPPGLSLRPDGSFVFVPPANFNGGESFSYRACDVWSICSAPATAAITVVPVNDDPQAFGDTARTNTGEVVLLDVLANDLDLDGDPIFILSVDDPPHGQAQILGGMLEYAPDPGYYSNPDPDVFLYQVSDGQGGTAAALIEVTVNGPPSAQDNSYVLLEDTPLVVGAPGVLGNDSDPNGDALEAILDQDVSSGSLDLQPDGSFVYTPAANDVLGGWFTYLACDPDGLCSAAARVDLTIVPVNDPPQAAADDGFPTIDEDDPVGLVVGAPGVLANDSDPVEGYVLRAVLENGPSNGTVELGSDGSFTYLGAANAFGADTFQYRACDSGDDAIAGTGDDACSDPAVVTVVVNPVNDAPLAVGDAAAVDESGSVTIAVLGNDSDLDGGLLPTSVEIVAGPAHGMAVPDGSGSILYSHGGGPSTGDSFSYRVQDDSGAWSNPATVSLSLNPPLLRVVKEANPTAAGLGDTVEFTIYIWNDGPGTAYGVSLADSLGSCFAFVGPNPSGSVGDLGPGEAWVALAAARVVQTGGCSGSNRADVSSLNAGSPSDTVSLTILP